jgi:hypothetical protein
MDRWEKSRDLQSRYVCYYYNYSPTGKKKKKFLASLTKSKRSSCVRSILQLLAPFPTRPGFFSPVLASTDAAFFRVIYTCAGTT